MSKITEVEIIPIKPINGLIGFASVVIDDRLYIGSIGIYRKLDNLDYRITYPTKKVGTKNINICHPITRELGWMIEAAIIKKASELFK
jgi:stage V sporulation protein G